MNICIYSVELNRGAIIQRSYCNSFSLKLNRFYVNTFHVLVWIPTYITHVKRNDPYVIIITSLDDIFTRSKPNTGDHVCYIISRDHMARASYFKSNHRRATESDTVHLFTLIMISIFVQSVYGHVQHAYDRQVIYDHSWWMATFQILFFYPSANFWYTVILFIRLPVHNLLFFVHSADMIRHRFRNGETFFFLYTST